MGFLYVLREVKIMNYCVKHGMLCEDANAYGYCSVTACSKHMKLVQVIYPNSNNIITFP